jgi:cephalosporin hydroxylase
VTFGAGRLERSLRAAADRLEADPTRTERVVADFHRLYYDAGEAGGTWKQTFWLGVPVWKCPLDLWIYQEIIHDLRPGLIVETGTAHGGSALYLASLCDVIGRGEVITIDTQQFPGRPVHPRIRYLFGSSTDPEIVDVVREAAATANGVFVMLDSDHRCAHVADELRMYAPLVPPGGYIVVEDTNVNGNPIYPDFGAGPMEAVEEFLAREAGWTVDSARQKLFMTFNPSGYLRRVPA